MPISSFRIRAVAAAAIVLVAGTFARGQMPHVHPDLRAAADVLRLGRFPSMRLSVTGPTPTEHIVPGPKGAPDVRIVVVNGGTATGVLRPAVLHMHGGGYTQGSPAQSVPLLQLFGAALDAVMVSVDYRLAPKTTYPGSLEDNYAALMWLYRSGRSIGVDPTRIAVMGESAGGGHAATLAIAARDRGEVPLVYQALIYPMLDDRTATTQKVPAHVGTLVWTAEANRAGWSALLGTAAGDPKAPVGAVPARNGNLAGLPPAFIGVGDIDLLAEENIAYADRLLKAAVPVELHVIPGAFHGFDIFAPDAPVTKQFRDALIAALKGAFSRA